MHHAKKVLLAVGYAAAALIAAAVLLWFGVTARYVDFFADAGSEFLIPGLSSNWVPQGFDYIEEQDVFLMCGYMSDGAASRVYVRRGAGDTSYVNLLYPDGTAYTKHAGGICHNGEFVYIAGDDGVDVFRLSDVLNRKEAKKIGKIPVGYDLAYCSFYNGYLLAGNFYYEGTYETPVSHRIKTPAGDDNKALITVFKADDQAQFGVDPLAVGAVSTRGKVQGICFTSQDEVVLCTSYGFASSQLELHRIDTSKQANIQTGGAGVPVIYLDSSTLVDTQTMPPMAEELVFKDGKVMILFESACNKYIYGKITRGYQVYSFSFDQEA